MKLQHLAIIFIIIILPISLVVSSYIQTQIDTINRQQIYSTNLKNATYDAIKAFQLNTINNKYSTISDSKIRDIEASINTFYNSMGTELGASGYRKIDLQNYIPAMLYSMYDGYYIYSQYKNVLSNNEQDGYKSGLKPYIYYSCRYKKGNNDFIVNYTLDNAITIYGNINGKYVTKSGYLINPELVDVNSIVIDRGNNIIKSLKYNGVTIERELLSEQLIIAGKDDDNYIRDTYQYIIYNNRKVYKDNNGYFWNNNNHKQYIQDNETLTYLRKVTEGGNLYSYSSVNYYYEAYEFSKWINEKLSSITQQNAVDEQENKITDFAINTGDEKIFNLTKQNDPTKESSTFNQNRISVIRRSIQTNMVAAIANYNSIMKSTEYEFVMPKFTEEDWDKIENNISVAVFMQGMPLGSKYFNEYCVITNDKNKEFVSKDSIYMITEDGEMHFIGCKDIVENNEKVVSAYRNTDFERQTVVITEGDEIYYYPHSNTRCYDCIVNSTSTYNIDEIIDGRVTKYNPSETNYETINVDSSTLRKVYLTALAREKYDLYKTNGYFDYTDF